MSCSFCGAVTDDVRYGACFDCASAGDQRLGRRTTLQHWTHAIGSLWERKWWRAKIDLKCGWERLTRSGEYAPGGEWEHL